MARDYGKVFTAAWGDPSYRALTGPAQHLYMQLVSQPDTTMAGVLTTAPARWAGQFVGGTAAEVQLALAELEAARFVVTDEVTMETLVRAFVRRDLGWRSPRTMIGIDSSIRAVLSPKLRGVLADELGRCDTSDLSMEVSAKTGRSTREVVEELIHGIRRDCTIVRDDQREPELDTPSDTPSHGVPDGVLSSSLTATATGPATANAPATAHEADRSPTLLEAPSSAARSARPSRAVYPDEFERFWAAYPDTRDKRKSLDVWRRVTREIPNDVLVEAAQAYREDPNRVPAYTKIATTWLNAGAWENGPLPPRGGGHGDNLTQSLSVVAQLRAERQARQITTTAPPTLTARRTA